MKDKSKKSTYSTTFGVDPIFFTGFGVEQKLPRYWWSAGLRYEKLAS